jgi:hypothetical protein
LGSTSRFIALHITATTHLSDEEINSIGAGGGGGGGTGGAAGASRRKYSNTANFQDFVSFYPSSYRISILWDIDVTNIPLYSPTLVPMVIHFPIRSAHLSSVQQLPSNPKRDSAVGESNSSHSSVSGTSMDSSSHYISSTAPAPAATGGAISCPNYCPVSLILLDSEGKVTHISLYNITSAASAASAHTFASAVSGDFTFESIGTVINLGLCTSISRLHHYLFPVTQSSPVTLQDIFYLHSQSPHSNDELLWLPHAISPDHHSGGVILSAFKRPSSSFLFTPPTDNMCSYLTYSSSLKLIGLSCPLSHSSSSPLSTSTAASSLSLSSTRPTLSLYNSSLPLIMLLSLINNACYLPKTSFSLPMSFISTLLIPFHTYSSHSTSWMKYMLSHLSLNPLPLQQLTEGLEIVLKSIINRPGFTRAHPDFAVLTSILFSCDDVLFIEIISRLSRKLEPHISASLFPLPNHHTLPSSSRRGNSSNSNANNSAAKLNFYRGIVIRDSPWDQLTLFEFCLSRCALQHASRFLTPACEQLGGSQTLESITASLILSHELLLECIRHLQLDCAMECLEFCMRLDVMAAEVSPPIPSLLSSFPLTLLASLCLSLSLSIYLLLYPLFCSYCTTTAHPKPPPLQCKSLSKELAAN